MPAHAHNDRSSPAPVAEIADKVVREIATRL